MVLDFGLLSFLLNGITGHSVILPSASIKGKCAGRTTDTLPGYKLVK
jgi:hypothetical protein